MSLGAMRGGAVHPQLADQYTTIPAVTADVGTPVQDAHGAVAVRERSVNAQRAAEAARRQAAARRARQRAQVRAARAASQAPPAAPVQAAPPVPSGGVLSPAQIGALWVAEGGRVVAEQTAECIAEAESGGNTSAVSPTGDDGLFQEHNRPDVLGNAALSTQVAIEMSGNGTNWSAWTTAGQC